jgi:hypothetical protein
VSRRGTLSQAIKGALLSGLGFPGLGQVFLRHYGRGLALILAVSGSLLVAALKIAQHTISVLRKIESEGGAIDMYTIWNAANRSLPSLDILLCKFVFLWIIICWIVGVVDAYRIGKRKDLEEESMSQVSSNSK